MSEPRVLILTASVGSGHDLPAERLRAALADRGASAEVVDALRAVGGPFERLVIGGSRFHTTAGNVAFDVEYAFAAQLPPTRAFAQAATARMAGPGLLRLIAQRRPQVVVSTYPGVSEVLGRLRRRGRIGQPVCSAITDLAALRWWAHPAIDLHLCIHPESRGEIARIAPRSRIVAVRGFSAPAFSDPPDRATARAALALPADGPVVVVSGGGWGVGDLGGAVAEARAAGAFAIVVCGHAEAVRAALTDRFAADPGVRVLGFSERLPELFAAADALVHTTAGLTILEAIMCGCAPISYGWGRAHLRANDRAYRRHGLARVARDRSALRAQLRAALAAPPPARDALAAKSD
ncbi:glycosyltransferase, partial [Conexibacter sp. CPCC 205706]|uniref:MGDG synthase family glycosyltransferase n=1 Tax=Conexibacter sp. CPCC 205706 TaxID=3064572 RepID=UPI002719DBF9